MIHLRKRYTLRRGRTDECLKIVAASSTKSVHFMFKYSYFSNVGENRKIHSNLPSNSRASTIIGESIADKYYFPKGNMVNGSKSFQNEKIQSSKNGINLVKQRTRKFFNLIHEYFPKTIIVDDSKIIIPKCLCKF